MTYSLTEAFCGDVDQYRPARARALLIKAQHEAGAARFWSLAVAIQLLEDHLTDLTTNLPDGPRRASRCLATRRRLARLYTAIGRHRPTSLRSDPESDRSREATPYAAARDKDG